MGASLSDTEKKNSSLGKKAGIGCLGLVAIIIVIGLIGGEAEKDGGAKSAAGNSSAVAVASENSETSNLTSQQKNAVRTANQYLEMSGFSKAGLIAQLSSDVADGYTVKDATAAVESLDVDWNEQAVRSAKQYLEMSGFSCKGLIRQLSSDVAGKFTVEQATYGAKKAGAC